jgi:hypothetical protein
VHILIAHARCQSSAFVGNEGICKAALPWSRE